MVALVAVSAGLGVGFWPKIKKAMNENNRQAKVVLEEDDDPPVVKPKDRSKPVVDDDVPPKPKDGSTQPKDKDKTAPKDKDKTSPRDKTTPKDKDKATPKDKTTPKDKDKTSPKDNSTPKDKDKGPPKDKDKTTPKDPPPNRGAFPRRALIVSVHNYLYANPVMPGVGVKAITGAPNYPTGLIPALTRLNVPLTQIYHVSDAAKTNPVPPLKPVIEQSITNFLKTSRDQDRIMVIFIGHAKEIDGQAYLVPLEGDFKDASTLIPISWVYDQLKECKARQKILVIDGNRYNAAQGEERPSAGEMTAKFEAALKAPPPGVEVWSACSATQQSNEFDNAPLGLFLDGFRRALAPQDRGEKGALEGRIQKHDDLIPLDVLQASVASYVTRRLEKRKPKQVPFVAGKPAAEGAAYNREAAPPEAPNFPTFKPEAQQAVKQILSEISLPPVKNNSTAGVDLSFTSLPPFPSEALKKYEGTLAADSALRKAIHAGRVALWAVSTATAPSELQGEIAELRTKGKFKEIGTILQDKYSHPGGGENAFKKRVEDASKEMSRVVSALEDALDEMKKAAEEVEAAPARWQANYHYVLARLQAQLVYLEEYQGLLGQIRKELPPYDATLNTGWRMAAKDKPSDSAAKKYFKEARKGFADLAKKNKGTPWEVLGKREELTALGLEWQAY
jgi:hypothetical protein